MGTQCFRIHQIPDPLLPRHQQRASKDVRTDAFKDERQLLQAISDFPQDVAGVSLRFEYEPRPKDASPHSRTKIRLFARADGRAVEKSLTTLITQGPLQRFYHLQRDTLPVIHEHAYRACCQVVRAEESEPPLFGSEFNPRIPECYYLIRRFDPNEDNDYTCLDRILGNLDEPVLIDICVEPANVGPVRRHHTQYLSMLHSINRSWMDEEDEETEIFTSNSSEFEPRRHDVLVKPLRRQEPTADEIHREAQRFHESLLLRHVAFHISVCARSPETARLVGSVVADSAFANGDYRLVMTRKGDGHFESILSCLQNVRVARVPADLRWDEHLKTNYKRLETLALVSPVEDIASAFRLPMAGEGPLCCLRKDTDPPKSQSADFIALGVEGESVSFARDGKTQLVTRGIPLDDLVKHSLICGLSGTGKSTLIQKICCDLHQNQIPFLILEPTKTEHRILKRLKHSKNRAARSLGESLEIFTPGNDRVSPFRFNPLRPPTGVPPEEWIDNLLTCFHAAMPLWGPLPALLGEGLEEVFEGVENQGDSPVMADLLHATLEALKDKGYSSDPHSDVRAALEIRLGSLTRRSTGRVFSSLKSIPDVDHLLSTPTLIEMDSCPRETAAFLTLLLLTLIRKRLRTLPPPKRRLHYVIIIEEAHNICGRRTDASPSEDFADPRAHAAEFICRMLAEVRALGVGIVIVDQHPSSIAIEVIKGTSTKLALRQVDTDDRECLAGSMGASFEDMDELSRLRTGEALLFGEGYFRPSRIQTWDFHQEMELERPPTDEEMSVELLREEWYRKTRNARFISEANLYLAKLDELELKKASITTQIAKSSEKQLRALANPDATKRNEQLAQIVNEANLLAKELASAHQRFERTHHRPFAESPVDNSLSEKHIALRARILQRYLENTRANVYTCLGKINSVIARATDTIEEV